MSVHTTSPVANDSSRQLHRVLGLKELVFYGIVLVQPTAPMPLFGVVAQEARGHVVTTVLFAMLAMLFTAVSYGRMAHAYPAAGSAYTYVGKEVHPALGYVTGWGMLFDYVMNPIICVIWCSKAAMNFMPEVPFGVWALAFAALFTGLNLRGIQSSARTNQWLATGLGVVIVLFFTAALRHLFVQPPGGASDWLRPFYDPATFDPKIVATGASIAMLTYIGFDGISTLSEEVENPRRNILYATVLTCLLTGVLAATQVYTAQLLWPDYATFPDKDTAFVHVAKRAGGSFGPAAGTALFGIVNLALLLATIGSGTGAHLGAGRLLYGMGRDNALPRRFFGALHPKTRIPSANIALVGAVALVGAFLMDYQLGAELLNFGASIAFMGVNSAAFLRYFWRNPGRRLRDGLPPLLGFLFCFIIWLNLRPKALLIGFIWLGVGLALAAWRSGGFRRRFEMFTPEDAAAPH
jgi:amino acid transporter